jgi:hypothetical protein
MNASDVIKARKKWKALRDGISPAIGNKREALEGMVNNGTLLKDAIATLDNGIQVVGYRDRQNRYAGDNYEVPGERQND